MAKVYIEYDPANSEEVAAVKTLFSGALEVAAIEYLKNAVGQILANQLVMQGKLDVATATLNSEGETITVITDQLQQLEALEVQEKQAIADAAARVQTSLSALQTQLATATGDDPGAATLINSVQTDVANLANIAAAAGTSAPVPALPPVSGTPVDNPTAAPVGATPTTPATPATPASGDINSVTV